MKSYEIRNKLLDIINLYTTIIKINESPEADVDESVVEFIRKLEISLLNIVTLKLSHLDGDPMKIN